ncbi:MAG: SDR family NAD(P)-dependent oxidoreductase [Acidobacteriota bacterium]
MTRPASDSDLLAPLRQALGVIEALEADLAGLREPIAVVGLACRFPGAADAEGLWRLLENGVDAIGEVPPERWSMDGLYDPDPEAPGGLYCGAGGFLDDVDRFDPLFFGISPREAARLDPQQRLLLEIAWHALEDAVIAPDTLRGSRTGVFVGIAENDYARLVDRSTGRRFFEPHDAVGTGFCFASGRLSHVLGLQGPNLAVDTGCSSSLVAIHQAMTSLRRGECDLALAGGVHLRLAPETTIALARARALAPDGRCKPFSAAADGFGRSEGCGLLVLRRLSEATRRREPVRAVLRGAAVNHDGAASGFTVPSERAQIDLLRAALDDAGLEPRAVGCIEAHGTGTPLGDPIEVGALATVFAEPSADTVWLGSIKSNFGHAEGAAGVAGVIKAVLALEHGVVPPSLHAEEENPRVPWDDLPFVVPSAPTPWPEARRVCGVSSFGMSGTNAHVLVEAAPSTAAGTDADANEAQPTDRPLHVLTLSAKTAGALEALTARWLESLAAAPADPSAFADLCHTAAVGRAGFEHRLAVVAADADAARSALAAHRALAGRAPAHHEPPTVAFLCTGQGAQYPGMARELADAEPSVRRDLEHCAEILRAHDVDLFGLLARSSSSETNGAAELDRTENAQPSLVAVEWALARLWRRWGVEPTVVAGHSLGEITAACLAGILTLDDALALAAARGRLLQRVDGAMVAVRADSATIERALEALAGDDAARVTLAAVNGPRDVVVSGARDAVDRLVAALESDDVACTRLPGAHAFHSPLVEPILDDFAAVVRGLPFAAPTLPFVSALDGKLYLPGEAPPSAEQWVEHWVEHWVAHVRRPVRWTDALATLAGLGEGGLDVYLEIGPKPQLLPTVGAPDVLRLPSLRPGRAWSTLLRSLATLWTRGTPIDWRAVDADHPRRSRRAPTTPFERQRYWLPAAPSEQPAEVSPSIARRDPFDQVVPSPLHDATLFLRRLDADDPAVAAHRVGGRLVVPAALQASLCLAAARRQFPSNAETSRDPEQHPVGLDDLVFERPLDVPDGGARALQLVATRRPSAPRSGDAATTAVELQLVSLDDESRPEPHATVHARAVLPASDSPIADAAALLAPIDTSSGQTFSSEDLDRRLAGQGFDLGPSLRWLRRLTKHGDQVDATLGRPAGVDDEVALVGLLDACFQATEALSLGRGDSDDETGEARLPFAVGSLRMTADATERACSLRARRGDDASWRIEVFDAEGAPVLTIDRFVDRPAGALVAAGARDAWREWTAEIAWRPFELPRGAFNEGNFGRAHVVDLAADTLWDADDAIDELVTVVGARGLVSNPDNDLEDAALAERWTARMLTLIQRAAAAARPPRLWIVTEAARAVDPEDDTAGWPQASLWGLARTVGAEHPELRVVCLDLETRPDDPAVLLTLLQTRLAAAPAGARLALRDDQLLAEALEPCGLPRAAPRRLVQAEAGLPNSLTLEPLQRRAPSAGEVELEVRAAALNFRDVLIALGLLEAPETTPGYDCAGIVTAVGAGCTLEVGDRVMALADGAFADFVTVDARRVGRLPSGIGFEVGAAVPLVTLTAQHALHHLAEIRHGERVLIHTATGGVGLAALQLARAAGAEVFTTASPGKHDTLRALGVEHVMSSRSLDFADEILAATEGRGVDVVLNTLAGDTVAASVRATAPGGRFVELGARDVWTAERMHAARPDIAFHCFDLGTVAEETPERIAAGLERIGTALEDGRLEPPRFEVFPLERAADAYRHMQQARHVGKVVLAVAPRRPRPDASYLVTGGLGGLGLAIAEGLARAGAGHLVLAARRADEDNLPSARRAALEHLRDAGADVHLVAADVTDPTAVDALVARCMEIAPLRGVVHAAGVLDDGVLARQSAERAATVLAPKLRGVLALEAACRRHSAVLDHFAAFSSVAALLDDGGQGPYAAANAALAARMEARHAVGEPALAIDWGPWSEVGMAARGAAEGTDLGAMIPPGQGVAAFLGLLESGLVRVAVDPGLAQRLIAADAGSEHSETRGAGEPPAVETGPADSVRQRLESLPPARRHEALEGHIEALLGELLALDRSIDRDVAFSDLGADSLTVVDLRNRLQRDLDVALAPTVAFEHPSLRRLGAHLAERLGWLDQDTTASESTPEPVGELGDGLAKDLAEDLADDELRALIDLELQSLADGRRR